MTPPLDFRNSTPGRVDRILADRLGCSRTLVHRLLAMGAVRLNGAAVRAKGHKLRGGERVEIDADAWAAEHVVRPRPDLELVLLALNDDWLAVDKPSGIGVHPLDGSQIDTLLNAAIARHPELQEVGDGGLRGGVVHRLDVGTSGVVVFARTQATWQRLRRAFSQHQMDKRYVAVVDGEFERIGSIEFALETVRSQPARVAVREGGRTCITRVRPLRHAAHRTLVEARPLSGHLHQIRVTLAELGHPIVGDQIYGGPPASRLALHAQYLSGAGVEAESPTPSEIMQLLDL